MNLDLNSDLGEGADHDAEILALVTSANISCGGHAGDERAIRAALRSSRFLGVQVGAHPGFADRDSFGRREQNQSAARIVDLCLEQVSRLRKWASDEGISIAYLKPHGALYNQACRDDHFAQPVVDAAVSLGLPLLALPGSRLETWSQGRTPFFREGFADRRYRPDGLLVPRTDPDAFVADPSEAVAQAQRLMTHQGIQSLCVHGDHPRALAFVQDLRTALRLQGCELRPFTRRSG